MKDLNQLLESEIKAYNATRQRLFVARQKENNVQERIELNNVEEHKKTIISIKNQIKNA